MSKQYLDDETGETVDVGPEDVHPIGLVVGAFVELDEGQFVHAAAVTTVLEMAPYRDATHPGKVYRCNVLTGDSPGTAGWSVYPARTVLAALNLALENGRQRRVERADY